MSTTVSGNSPYISVIIPAYNARETLPKLLLSLTKSTFRRFEVIIGDDASADPVRMPARKFSTGKRSISVRVVRLNKNSGPAAARNAAAKKARGRILVFLDSDVEVYPDTLQLIADKFRDDHDLHALTGVWDKHQRTTSFFPQYKALRDWSYWTNERDRDGYYYLFSTRVAALRRGVFERLGGFNEAFRQMEDVEITYRIARRYAIIFDFDVRVHHEFEDFWPVAKKYFWRSYYWTMLYSERRKFDPVATTRWESLAAITGAGIVASLGLGSMVFFLISAPMVREVFLGLSLVMLVLHCVLLRKFLIFVYKEKGIVFTLQSLATGICIYCFVVLGAGYALLRRRV